MKRYISFTIILLLSFIIKASASTGTVICTDGDTSPLNVRDEIFGNPIGGLACNSTVEILNENAGSNGACNTWYQIKQGMLTGYSCGTYININKEKTNLKGKVSCVENDDPLTVRNSIGGEIIDRLSCDTEMKILDNSLGKSGYCSNWYKVSYKEDKVGYVCGTYVITEVDVDYNDNDVKKYRDSLKSAGFPESYLDDLVKVHLEYPTWNFIPFNTNLDWNTVIENESVKGRNLIYYTYGEGYRSLKPYSYNWATDEYYRDETEINWWYASPEAIKYYMDPRNYLNSKNIFTFESLSYEPSFQTGNIVSKILGNSFMPDIYSKYNEGSYIDAFMEAASTYKVSPVHLASRILQEQGPNGSPTALGGSFNYNGNTYSGYFNLYNIKALGNDGGVSSLVWAMGGANQSLTSYNRPWNSPYKSILGGALFLSEDYISVGQNTLYFQKFDVSRSDGNYVHQYMQNLTAPLTEGVTTYSSYSNISGLLNEALVFIIPIYNNMPEAKVEAPRSGNPNSYLKNIKINNTEINNFTYDNNYYELEVEAGTSSVNITADTINSKAKVTGVGNINLNNGKNEVKLLVTAENGNTSTYTLIINKKEKEEDIVLSNINNLKSLTIDKIDFEFDKDTLEYNLEVEFKTDKIKLSYELEDNSASVSGDREVELVVGTNIINIIVTAQNKEEKTYTLNITRKNANLSEILNNSGIKYNDKYIYGINLNTSVNSLIENIKKISSSVLVTIKDKNNNNKNGSFATGDKVIIKSGSEEKTYEALIYGDVNGDGTIDKLDYLAVLRQYYGYASYEGVYKSAMDVNGDGTIDKLDYLKILRHHYGYAYIEQ